MKERAIKFCGSMVRAILECRKTKTRRVLKPMVGRLLSPQELAYQINSGNYTNCPYGKPGDRLWVQETTVNVEEHGYKGPVYVESEIGQSVLDFGLGPEPGIVEVAPHDIRMRPSVHMPREFCRIVLEVNSIHVERLQDISEEDAVAEGVERAPIGDGWRRYGGTHKNGVGAPPFNDARSSFRSLWELLKGDGSCDENPLVLVIGFKQVGK